MCNNNGTCRKFDANVMCPSYRATRDEQHLTRGRANTLRLALTGQLPGALASDEVAEAVKLCVSCKGCKRECPTGVDMARMKIEVLAARAKTARHRLARTHHRDDAALGALGLAAAAAGQCAGLRCRGWRGCRRCCSASPPTGPAALRLGRLP